MNIRWGLFDDTPDRVAKSIEKVRPVDKMATTAARGDKHQAKDRLAEARNLLGSGQIDKAEAIALEVEFVGAPLQLLRGQPRQDRRRRSRGSPS